MSTSQLGLFDGATFDPDRDGPRLGRSLDAVRRALGDGEWWTLADLARAASCSVASASARVRDLRKQRFGGHVIERRYQGDGVWLYALRGEGE